MNHSAELKINPQALQINRYLIAALALFIIPISGLTIDIYVPSLPAISHYFGVDKTFAQLTITVYMIGLGIVQLFAGPISDSFGRRKPFLLAMFIYFIATLFIPFAHTISQLLLLRFLQGVSVALTVVPMRSVISDLFEGKEYYKMITYMTMAWSIGPIIAPAIGGYMQNYFGWQANFYFLAIYSFISLLLNLIFLSETSRFQHPFQIRKILVRYQEILSHKAYWQSLISNSLLYSLIILFTIVGPFLIQTVLHYSPVDFGRMALLTGLAWFLGSVINRFLIHISIQKKSLICFCLMFAIVVITLAIELFIPMNIYLILIPIMLLLTIGGIIFPNNFARGLALFPKMTGSANALFGGFVFLITGISSGLGTYLKATTNFPLLIAYVGIIGFCLLIHYLDRA